MELIKIEEKDGKQLVSAKELHEFLGIDTRFDIWIKRRIEKYEFIENVDYTTVVQKRTTAQGNECEYKDYVITIEMAKELSMVENNDKGKEARKYFITCEKKLKEVSIKDKLLLDLFSSDPLVVASAHKQLVDIEKKPLLDKIEEDKPKVDGYDIFLNKDGLMPLGKLAKHLGYGRNKFIALLKENKILMKNRIPYQKYMKYFKIKITSQDGLEFTTSLANKEGVKYLTKRFKLEEA